MTIDFSNHLLDAALANTSQPVLAGRAGNTARLLV